ncbi:MAG: hypothetical protein A3D87_02380 [Omnitrophica WOR_2 bacterium RIFCSPHIGHO2_02_FULL_50_17]|nr:MAG: hypothetical protein A3D87_02380 [Omnitrophica WOR_2 bacterium RIFCSPHIGHO2_02_FULL_50_17]
MRRFADLHIHTLHSDSTLSPQEVVEQARQNGLSCVGITDHDILDGIPPAFEEAKKYDLEVVAGIELSCEMNGREVHILGYLFDCAYEPLRDRLKVIQNVRAERMKMMIAKLESLGIEGIRFEDVAALANTKALGRPHLAMILQKKGIVGDIKGAFDRYLAEGAPAYAPKFKQTPGEAIRLIREAGGVAVLAHPMLMNRDEIIPGLVREGLQGLEVYYPNCAVHVIQFYEHLAKKHALCMTGGSDAHGSLRGYTFVGKVKIPYELVEKLKERVHGP